jgi:hypothetical protein
MPIPVEIHRPPERRDWLASALVHLARWLGTVLGFVLGLVVRLLTCLCRQGGRFVRRTVQDRTLAPELEKRTSLVMLPEPAFEPKDGEVHRFASHLFRLHPPAGRQRAGAVRIRLDSAPGGQLAYRIDAPAWAEGPIEAGGSQRVVTCSLEELGLPLGVPDLYLPASLPVRMLAWAAVELNYACARLRGRRRRSLPEERLALPMPKDHIPRDVA